MSPFKEPQPRKLTDADMFPKPKASWPPYERTGSEARWDGGTPIVSDKEVDETAAEKMLLDQTRVPIMVHTDATSFEYRKAALEAACAIQSSHPTNTATTFWNNVGVIEEYLRDGTKP